MYHSKNILVLHVAKLKKKTFCGSEPLVGKARTLFEHYGSRDLFAHLWLWRPDSRKFGGPGCALFSRYFALRYRYERLLGVILALFCVIFIFRILWIFGVPTLPSPWHRWLTTPFEQPWISMKSGSAVPTAAKSRPSPYESWQ